MKKNDSKEEKYDLMDLMLLLYVGERVEKGEENYEGIMKEMPYLKRRINEMTAKLTEVEKNQLMKGYEHICVQLDKDIEENKIKKNKTGLI